MAHEHFPHEEGRPPHGSHGGPPPGPEHGPPPPPPPPPPTRIVLEQPRRSRWWTRLLLFLLAASVLLNVVLFGVVQEYFGGGRGPTERFHSGDREATDKIALVKVEGTIMPPFTRRIIKSIRRAREDDAVKGVVLVVDSPGGLVADSHEIYHELTKLREEKPIYVSMKRMAASGGYYVAMGAGPDGVLFAEPTTWTGSIGVIIPRYDLSQLVEKVGVRVEPLKTGPFKDSLSPFRPLTPEEQKRWERILDDAYQRFLHVIADNRSQLDLDKVKKLATGEVFTATEAKANGLVDQLGFLDDAVEALAERLKLEEYRVVEYHFQPSLWELLAGEVRANDPSEKTRRWLEATVPQALYYCSWLSAPLPTSR